MPTRHRCDIRARLKALRQNSRPLLITPAHMARRPGDQLDAAIAFATVLMSVIMTVILHGDIRPIHGPLTMLSDAARFGRCDRRAAYVRSGRYPSEKRIVCSVATKAVVRPGRFLRRFSTL